jgi:hypothetical protein
LSSILNIMGGDLYDCFDEYGKFPLSNEEDVHMISKMCMECGLGSTYFVNCASTHTLMLSRS